MIELTAQEIADMTGGVLAAGTDPQATATSATTDSREVREGSLFIAKPGEHADGHDFVPAALQGGASLVLAQRELRVGEKTVPAVVVPDVVLAMGKLAAALVARIREQGELTVIGITGSAGKTTTKDLLAGILSVQGPTVAPIGSYNGEVGVPLTVFNASLDTRYLVIEMGATMIGNITYLTDMVRPDIGVVLFVGTAHAGEFGGVENIAVAKSELAQAIGTDGHVVLNRADQRVRAMAEVAAAPVLFFDAQATEPVPGEVTVTAVEFTDAGFPRFTLTFPNGEDYRITAGLLGEHHLGNIAAAAAAAFAAGVPTADIAGALDGQGPQSRWRMERTERADGVTIINDAYNANPESMRAALKTLAELGRERRTWAVLGEMLELGEDSILAHDEIGRTAVRLNISKVLAIGPGAKPIHTGAWMEGSWDQEANYVDTLEDAERFLNDHLQPGDLVLFKSSNSSGLRHLGDRIALQASHQETQSGESTP